MTAIVHKAETGGDPLEMKCRSLYVSEVSSGEHQAAARWHKVNCPDCLRFQGRLKIKYARIGWNGRDRGIR